MSACKSCGAPVEWREHIETGRRAPVNVTPDPKGNVVLEGEVQYRVLTHDEIETFDALTVLDAEGVLGSSVKRSPARYTLHFTDCPNAAGHRTAHPRKAAPASRRVPPPPTR